MSEQNGRAARAGDGLAGVAFRSTRVLTPSGIEPATVLVRGQRIHGVHRHDWRLAGDTSVVDVGDNVLMPGLVDFHVHVHEPDSMESEGFESATRAAAAGGITTIVDMPNTNDPMTGTLTALDLKQSVASGSVYVDTGFWGGLTRHNVDHLEELTQHGVFGFKCFLPGVGDSAPPPGDQLATVLRELASYDALTIWHAEDMTILEATPPAPDPSFRSYVESQPEAAELVAIARLVELGRATGVRVHIVHLSAGAALPLIARAQAEGVRITAETCPHYLYFSDGDVRDGATVFKCSPPIRGERNRELLWQGLRDGVIGGVVSDHAPWTPEFKAAVGGDFREAGPGISSLQLTLPVTWTSAAARGHRLEDVSRWMSSWPADFLGLKQKGRLVPGADADLVEFDPDGEFVVEAAELHHKVPLTAYDGERLRGRVLRTWLRGTEVDVHGAPRGLLLSASGTTARTDDGEVAHV